MQRLGTPGRGKTLKTSPPAIARRRGQFFGQKLVDWVALERETKFVHTHSGIFDPFTSSPDKSVKITMKLDGRRMRRIH